VNKENAKTMSNNGFRMTLGGAHAGASRLLFSCLNPAMVFKYSQPAYTKEQSND